MAAIIRHQSYNSFSNPQLMFGKINFPGKQQPPKPTPVSNPKTKPIQKAAKKAVQGPSRAQTSLKGSKFRIINQLLYTRPSGEALKHFQEHREDFETYHEGFREQASKWSQNPLHTLIAYLKKHHCDRNKLILDLGCGQALLHEKMAPHCQVRSFDLVAQKECVEVADIAHLPLGDKCADVAVFCLSLMGLNYLDFLEEAARVLKDSGELLIAEVESRCKDWGGFTAMVESLGFECRASKTNGYFRLLYLGVNRGKRGQLVVGGERKQLREYSAQILGGCLYKKR